MNRFITLAGALLLAWPAFAGGGLWNEDGDAGPLPPGQMTMGEGSLDFISGSLSSTDLEDMYCITITDEEHFSATTVGGADFDTQLFLFDANGMGVAFDDDDPGGGSLQSRLSSAFVTSNGTYYLAISNYDHDATSAGGEIWADSPFGVERAPDGPGAGSPISGWGGSGGSGSSYRMSLTGASYCTVPEPATFVAIGLGLAAFAASRRRR
jgi:hypothetical protein